MEITRTSSLETLNGFANSSARLGIVEREIPPNMQTFLDEVLSCATPFQVEGPVRKDSLSGDIRNFLEKVVCKKLRSNPCYEMWFIDIIEVCKAFYDILQTDKICFWMGSHRGCQRYHIDNVPVRLLLTYTGKGTEWLSDDIVDFNAYRNGDSNELIVKDKSKVQFINQWDVALFKGKARGVLHRTPDAALYAPSILMKLDSKDFLEKLSLPN